ncbi:hypothetical protein [Kribbella sp. NPDC004875]|uniref:hypothetical protein n=1 Tax=Kribbella sp. NPDC004875 TaxID=3364107 RepID=UPI0036AACE02
MALRQVVRRAGRALTMAGDERFLRELDVEVEAGIERNAEGAVPDDEQPGEWLADPFEVEAEAADLNSLHGAIVALQGEPGADPTVVSS